MHKLALNEIQKLVPRKPQRLNEISHRFHSKFSIASDKPEDLQLQMEEAQKCMHNGDSEKPQDDDELNQDYLKDTHIQFISTIDSKPVHPTYLRLMSLKAFIKLAHAQK